MKCMYNQSKRGLPSDVWTMALGVSAGRAATRQEPEDSIAMEHRHGGEDD